MHMNDLCREYLLDVKSRRKKMIDCVFNCCSKFNDGQIESNFSTIIYCEKYHLLQWNTILMTTTMNWLCDMNFVTCALFKVIEHINNLIYKHHTFSLLLIANLSTLMLFIRIDFNALQARNPREKFRVYRLIVYM